MNLFKSTTWKWWELKLIAWGSLLLGLALGTQFSSTLIEWTWLLWAGFLLFWTYIIFAWLKK